MNQQNTEQLIELVNSLKDRFNQKEMRRLDLDRLVRILIRLDSFSPECEDCKKLLVEMDNCLNQLAGLSGALDKQEYNRYKKLVDQAVYHAVDHLQKKHKLVTPGYYTSTYMTLGLSFGVAFGLAVFDNLALGLCFGLAIGVAIGSAQDADAKKTDRII